MKTTVKIAWRNIWRNPKRSIVMMASIAAGLTGGIAAASLVFGMMEHRFVTSIEQHISHIQIHNPEFLADNILSNYIEEFPALEKELSADGRIVAFSPRMVTEGMFAAANVTRGINIIAVDPTRESTVSNLDKNLVEGEYLSATNRNPLLIGRALSEKQKLRVGSRVVLTFQRDDGELASAAFRVSGIYQTGNSQWDENTVYIKGSDIAAVTGRHDLINEVAIITGDADGAALISDEYSERWSSLSVRPWDEIAPELNYLHQMAGTMLLFILGIILLALAFGLVNTMLMSVFERIRELGMLMAIGMNRRRIIAMIMLETTFMTLAGAAAGMTAGALLVYWFGVSGLDLAVVGGDSLNEFGFPSVVYPSLDWAFYRNLTVMVIVTALATAIFPAIKAVRLKPAEAVKAI